MLKKSIQEVRAEAKKRLNLARKKNREEIRRAETIRLQQQAIANKERAERARVRRCFREIVALCERAAMLGETEIAFQDSWSACKPFLAEVGLRVLVRPTPAFEEAKSRYEKLLRRRNRLRRQLKVLELAADSSGFFVRLHELLGRAAEKLYARYDDSDLEGMTIFCRATAELDRLKTTRAKLSEFLGRDQLVRRIDGFIRDADENVAALKKLPQKLIEVRDAEKSIRSVQREVTANQLTVIDWSLPTRESAPEVHRMKWLASHGKALATAISETIERALEADPKQREVRLVTAEGALIVGSIKFKLPSCVEVRWFLDRIHDEDGYGYKIFEPDSFGESEICICW